MAGSVIEMEKPLHYGNRCDIFKMEKKAPEATRPHPVSLSMRIFSFICLLFLWSSNALADPVSELASFSVFDKIDLATLAKGDPNVAHVARAELHVASRLQLEVLAAEHEDRDVLDRVRPAVAALVEVDDQRVVQQSPHLKIGNQRGRALIDGRNQLFERRQFGAVRVSAG